MLFKIILVFFSVSFIKCELIKGSLRISGGRDAFTWRWHYFSRIFLNETLVGYGVLVTESCVVTSAYNLGEWINDNKDWSYLDTKGMYAEMKIVVNADNIHGRINSDVLMYYVHPGHDPLTGNHDLAVLILKDKMDLKYLPKMAIKNPEPGTVCTAIGIGPTNLEDVEHVYKQADVRIADMPTCFEALKDHNISENNLGFLLCTVDDSIGMCYDEEGSPLVCNGELSGIASYSQGCGRKNQVAVYTSIPIYLNWIANTCEKERTRSSYRSRESIVNILFIINVFINLTQ